MTRDGRGDLERRLGRLRLGLHRACGGDRWAVAFSSCHPGAGASTLVFDFAGTLAAEGLRVLLVDADLRRPTLHEFTGTTRAEGLVELAAGDVDCSRAVRPTRHGFSLLPAGREQDRPIGFFRSDGFRDVVNRLRAAFDVCLFDAAPLDGDMETAVLGAALDGVVLVLESERTRRVVGQVARRELEASGARLLGAVLNKRKYHIPESIYRRL